MCEQGTSVPMPILGRVRDIDSCIALLVATLNTVPRFTTSWCCCGHGKMLPVVGLDDGSHLLMIRDKATFDKIEALLIAAGIQRPLHPRLGEPGYVEPAQWCEANPILGRDHIASTACVIYATEEEVR